MEQSKKIKVALADDHTIVREGLRYLLEGGGEIEVVGEAANGVELLALLEGTPADVALLDLRMPVMDGLEAARQIAARFPRTKVVALTMRDEAPCVHSAVAAGAAGFLLKTSGREELAAAVKLVAGGGRYLSASVALGLLRHAAGRGGDAEGAGKGGLLSRRELEVLRLVAEGRTNTQIADRLFTSKRTIESHRQHIIEKTGARNTANLIMYAIRHGYIRADS